jgi:pyruvate/2-oxoglutarate dehydrogenase complex dihydrolipoamide acyltransferase (E2) component
MRLKPENEILKGVVMFASASLARNLARLTAAAAAVLAVGATAATLGTSAASASTHTQQAQAGTQNWIMTGWGIHLNNQADSATTSHFFNTASSFGTGPNNNITPISDGFATSGVLSYTSYAQFADDISAGAITYPYKWVAYDPEAWSQTPPYEQRNPAKYLRLFGQLAHAHGYKVIELPARDLGTVPGSACPTQPGESLDPWYIRCNIAGAAAAYSDVYVLQDQVNTTSVSEFAYLYNTARAQAQAANPQIVTDTEVSTNYGTSAQMVAAAQSVTADGYYISATSPTLPQADQFLQQMQAAGY